VMFAAGWEFVLFSGSSLLIEKKACSVLMLQGLFSMILAGKREAGWSDWLFERED